MERIWVSQSRNSKSRLSSLIKSHFHSLHSLTSMMMRVISSLFLYLVPPITHFSLFSVTFNVTPMRYQLNMVATSQLIWYKMPALTKRVEWLEVEREDSDLYQLVVKHSLRLEVPLLLAETQNRLLALTQLQLRYLRGTVNKL
jgi:hypothetical protein